MRIYSNSFFHFTKDVTTIQYILEQGFKVFFCKEEIYSDKHKNACIGIPMTSFCDIPLSYITQINYGKTGIGMSRSWGIAHYLQPVIYYPNNKECQSTQMIIHATESFYKDPSKPEAYRILGYAKPLYKLNPSNGINDNNYIEREWRKVYASHHQFKWKNATEYNTYRGPKNLPKPAVGVPLKFSAGDVDFIIIERRHAQTLRDFIMRSPITHLGGKQNVAITSNDREILLSKIVIYETLVENM